MKKIFEIYLFFLSGFIINLAFLNILNWIYNIILFLGGICISSYICINNCKS